MFLDDNNQPINASTSAKILEDKVIQEALAQNGWKVTSVVVPEPSGQTAQKCKWFV